MLSSAIVLVFGLVCAWAGASLLPSELRERMDPAERLGFGGLLMLGVLGTLTFLTALVSTSALITLMIVPVGVLVWRRPPLAHLKGKLAVPGPVLGLLCLIPWVNALAPSDVLDWDTLAYHLAVPKLWIEAGRIEYLPTIHHSNFPFVFDSLFLMVLKPLGEHGAKTFTLVALILGLLALFGLARRWTHALGAWTVAFGFASIPVVLWESGSGYIDVGHGLWAGLGLLAAGEALREQRRERLVLAALMLGFACASKYTGLQTLVAVCACYGVGALLMRLSFRTALHGVLVVGVIGVSMASPWLIRNILNTGNPVYPFLYERFGGRNWDAWRAATYKNEQQTFGLGRTETGRNFALAPHSIVGLASQPGRFINPGQESGRGFPMGAVGIVPLVGLFGWLISGRRDPRMTFGLAASGLMLFMWFVLSQQSRYIIPIALPGLFALAFLMSDRIARFVAPTLVAAQCLYTAWMLYTVNTTRQLPVVLGRQSAESFLAASTPFAAAAQAINADISVKKVALYDEVFGYFLDVPYVWANPGHSLLFRYESMARGEQLIARFRELGISHVYLNLRLLGPAREAWEEDAVARSEEARAKYMSDLNRRWLLLLAEARSEGLLREVSRDRGSVLLEVAGS